MAETKGKFKPGDFLKKPKEAFMGFCAGLFKRPDKARAGKPQLFKKLGAALNKEKISGMFNNLKERVLHAFGPGLFTDKKRRPLLFAAGGLAVLFLVLVIAAILWNSGGSGTSARPDGVVTLVIPAGELFIPAEPDFVPGFIPEREVRHFWTVEDIRPYWRIPEKSWHWQGEITSSVDILLEGVP